MLKKEKERKDAYPKKVCHMLARACQKKVDSPCWKESHAKEFILKSPEIVQTLAHLDQTV